MMSNENEEPIITNEGIVEIFVPEQGQINGAESIVEGTLQVIAESEGISGEGIVEGTLQVIAESEGIGDETSLKHGGIVEGTLQVIAQSEGIVDETSLKQGEDELHQETQVTEVTGDGIKTIDGKQVLIVAAQDAEENIDKLAVDGKQQFLILTSPDSMPLGVSDIDSLKDGVKSELATKQYQIQGQDGQSYLLTVAGKCQRKYRVSDIDSLKDGVKSELATKQYQIQGQDGQSYLLTVAGENQGGSLVQLPKDDLETKKVSGSNRGVDKKSQLLKSDVSQAWFTSRDDKNMLQNNGTRWKQGQWTKDEVDLLQINISDYCKEHFVSDPTEIIFEMSKDERKQFYRTVARGLHRPLFSVYRRVIRMYDQKNHMGKYSPEEMVRLRELRSKYGNDWAQIGQALGRSASSVKDKCRLMKDTCNSGKWLPDEERRLTDAVYLLSGTQPGENVVQGLSWSHVAEKVITRSEKQCRTKWLNYLNWKQKGGTEWTREDDLNLILRVVNLGASNDTEIDWNELSKGWKSVRSPQWLRGKWWSLKRHIPDYQLMPYNQLLDYMKSFYLNCRVRPLTGSRSQKAEPAVDQGVGFVPITLREVPIHGLLEETAPVVQTFEVLHQLPETSGSFAIDQPQVNTSVVQSRFSEHDQIIVQAVPVSQQTTEGEIQIQSHVVVPPSDTGSLCVTEPPDLSTNIALSQDTDLQELTEENVISQTDSLSADHSTFDTTSLVEEDMVEPNDNVIILKTQTESPVLLAPTYVTSGSNDGELMTSFSDPMLNSDSNNMMEGTSDMDGEKTML